MDRYRFGQKHIDYMRRCRHSTFNVAEGAVRAGKTVDHTFVFAELLERSPDRIHALSCATAFQTQKKMTPLPPATFFGVPAAPLWAQISVFLPTEV